MSAVGRSFGAQLDDWLRETEQRMEAVFLESARRVVALSQEYIVSMDAVDTGFMRASVQVSLSEMPKIDPKATGGVGAKVGGDFVLSIAGARLGNTIYAGYTAAYAVFVHDGTSKMAGRPYVNLAALQWPRIVQQVSNELKGRISRANLNRALGRPA